MRNIGSLTQEIYKKLQFAEPKMVSDHGGGGGGEERTLDKGMCGWVEGGGGGWGGREGGGGGGKMGGEGKGGMPLPMNV